MIHTRVQLGRGPQIGEKAAFYQTPDVIATGTIMDIRDVDGVRTVFLALFGWPQMTPVPAESYREMRDGVWRKCSHSRGYNAAGLCFDCSAAERGSLEPMGGDGWVHV